MINKLKMKLPRAYARGIFSPCFVGSGIPPKQKVLRIHPADTTGFLRRGIKNKISKIQIKNQKFEFFSIGLILFFSAFFRLYKLDQLLGFWYDQGRDALVIWDLLHYGKLFLIGPVTGIEGIFLGPFYYYLLAPFYWIGKGDPVVAAAGIALLAVGAIFLVYLLGKRIFNEKIGLLAAFLLGFSYSNVIFSRWLANPAPLPFFTMVIIFFLYRFINGDRRSLIFAALFIGLCLQLEAASAVFFIPATLIIILWKKKNLEMRTTILSLLVFFITLMPQLYFNYRHENILVNAFKKFLVEEKSFKFSFFQIVKVRLMLYYDVFSGYFFPNHPFFKIIVLALFSAPLFLFRKKLFNSGTKLLLVWFLTPLCGFLFYRGNHGYIWDYYFAGIIPVFILLFSAAIYYLAKKSFFFKIPLSIFLVLFLIINVKLLVTYYKQGIGITLGAEKRALDWIYEDVGGDDFNVDVYVPPQIYFSYSYLFQWYGKGRYGREPNTKLVKNLYTLYESDSEHPWFLNNWLKRQDGIGKIVGGYSWGDVSVQKRERIKYE